MPETTYHALMGQIRNLQIQADALREKEKQQKKSEILAQMDEIGISAAQIRQAFEQAPAPAPAQKSAAPEAQPPKAPPRPRKPRAKYMDPATRATWNGLGRAPSWMAGQDRRNFSIRKVRAQLKAAAAGQNPQQPAAAPADNPAAQAQQDAGAAQA